MKIQYFTSDLSYALKIGEIKEMHIDQVNGRSVLRIECEEAKEDEYQTVRVTKQPKSKPKKQSSSRAQHREPETREQRTNPNDLGGKIIDMGKKFLANKEKPNFMKDAGF